MPSLLHISLIPFHPPLSYHLKVTTSPVWKLIPATLPVIPSEGFVHTLRDEFPSHAIDPDHVNICKSKQNHNWKQSKLSFLKGCQSKVVFYSVLLYYSKEFQAQFSNWVSLQQPMTASNHGESPAGSFSKKRQLLKGFSEIFNRKQTTALGIVGKKFRFRNSSSPKLGDTFSEWVIRTDSWRLNDLF